MDPWAACFVIANVSSLAEYRQRRGTAALDWARLTVRQRVTVFVASDTSPHGARDRLHTEIAQALGPLNDLYRLPDPVFNDDTFQSVLTGFDMLMLRLHASADLASGMTAAEVAALLPALLARLNPGGEGGPPSPGPDTPQPRRDAASGALRPETPAPARLVAARRMQEMARPSGWQDNRLGFARFVLGRLQTAQDRAVTATALTAASDVYATLPDQGIHLAQALMQLGGLAVARGQYADAIARACRARPPAILAQTAAPLDWLQLIKAEALAA